MAIQIIPNYRKARRRILQEPDERLRTISKKISEINNNVIEITSKLVEILKELDTPFIPWLGMAAPQIGYNVRIIAIKKRYGKYRIMVNPEFLDQKWFLPTLSSCYSLKGLYLRKSPYWVKLKYTDLKNKNHIEIFQGGMAILLKQELDHLEGRLICD